LLNWVVMLPMQTLGLSESTPRTENRLKSLFWPSIQTGSDVDYLGTQGYWVCVIVAGITFLATIARLPVVAIVMLLYFFLGGVGVRERDRYAAAVVFALYFIDMMLRGPGVVSVLISALLLSNVRATWIAWSWNPASEDAVLPPRMGDTFLDKFADKLPAVLWPRARYVYYVFSALVLLVSIIGAVAVRLQQFRMH
jgi:hypothetical protein